MTSSAYKFFAGCLAALMLSVSSAYAAITPVSVTASSQDGENGPLNTIDNDDVDSRWSGNGDGVWIQYDLGDEYTIRDLDIAFYKGDSRVANFEIQVSNNGSSWTTISNTGQQELTTSLQNIDVTDTDAEYLRIVGYGNSSNSWTSLLGVDINGELVSGGTTGGTGGGDGDLSGFYYIKNLGTGRYIRPLGDDQRDLLDISLTTDDAAVWELVAKDDYYFINNVINSFNIRADENLETRNNPYLAPDEWEGELSQWAFVETDTAYRVINRKTGEFIRQRSNSNRTLTQYPNTYTGTWTQWVLIEADDVGGDTGSSDTGGDTGSGDTGSSDTGGDTGSSDTGGDTGSSDTGGDTGSTTGGTTGGGTTGTTGGTTGGGDLDSVPDINCTENVSSSSQLEDATGYSMSAGTTVCIADGTYNNVELEIGGNGSESRPIHITAANPGRVFFERTAQVRMSGSHVIFQGVTFQNGDSADGDLFQTRGGGNLTCDNCRITEVVVQDWDDGFEDSNRWLLIYGQYNRIDHSWFSGKPTRGALMTIDRGEITDPDYAQVDHNYFGDRLPFDGGEFPGASDNEFEGIRIGTSDTQAFDSFSRVEYNFMERMRGEAEVISVKSGSNVIANNTVRSSYGGIVNRHGGGSIISNNFIFSDGYGMSGGIRISGADHSVMNNYIEGCTFTGSSFNGGIVLTKTDGSQATSGYQQVDNVLIAHNTLVNCIDSIKLEGGRSSSSTLPRNVSIINNVVADAVGPVFASDYPSDTYFAGNYFDGDSLGLSSAPSGVSFTDANLSRASDGLYRPSNSSVAVNGGTTNFNGFTPVDIDMDGQGRAGIPDSGADEVESGSGPLRPLTANDVGPLNYRP